ncbi:Na+/H+ antiporter subunit C [Ectothiorhodospira shaposhnikovii]|uniref:NADH-quinone oxidoreductase subunit K n=1 Tax=Ectothiorhodospira shaposhnikovii TaxID=1054 RepID=UPI00190706DF|nr:NADH-quinone oxidoreductase subunit K [Ectothiorhodospira shaposhnikovii]MBK1672015.1 Na+/H+ antiporter subunit C [Ectothiorhodospira shaposhnikovii]
MAADVLTPQIYLLCGVLLFVLGLHALVVRRHLLLKILAVNVMGSGVFMVLLGVAAGGEGGVDPVPHALVITGIVVAVSATAVALVLMLRVKAATGLARLPRSGPED